MNFRQPARAIGLAIATFFGFVPLVQAAEGPVLNVYNWAEYLPDGLLAQFQKETGIKVNYDTYDSNEVLNAKLVAGQTGYDIVVPSANWAALQIPAGLYRKLDRSKLTNWKNLDPDMLERLAQLDPGNQYLVDWAWGYTSIGINVEKVKEALGGTPMPANSYDLLFDPKYADKIKSCGISVLDSATEVFPVALAYLGRDPYSTKASDYEDASKVIAKIRGDIKVFSSSGYIDDMANGGLCLALGYSGDFNIAGRRAREAKQPFHIVPLIPSGGGLLFMDNMAIPADAPHPENAMTFINFILRPENAAAITNKMYYATMNQASIKLVKPDIAQDKTIFLSDADKKKLIPARMVSNDMRRVMTRLFTRFKSGL